MPPVQQGTRSTRFFDRLTRRAAVIGGAASVVTLGVHRASAQQASPVAEATPVAVEPISYLFVQYAGQTTFTPGASDVHTLTLNDIRSQTLFFSDRPNRIAGDEQTASFVDRFSQDFAGSPPNASLIAHRESGTGEEDAMVLTLLSAVYDPAAATLTYDVQLLQGDEVGDQTVMPKTQYQFDEPRTYAESSIFIDNVLVGAALDSSCSNGDCTDSCCAPGCQGELIDCASYGIGVSGFWNCVC